MILDPEHPSRKYINGLIIVRRNSNFHLCKQSAAYKRGPNEIECCVNYNANYSNQTHEPAESQQKMFFVLKVRITTGYSL
jgi:hypothetical protein